MPTSSTHSRDGKEEREGQREEGRRKDGSGRDSWMEIEVPSFEYLTDKGPCKLKILTKSSGFPFPLL